MDNKESKPTDTEIWKNRIGCLGAVIWALALISVFSSNSNNRAPNTSDFILLGIVALPFIVLFIINKLKE